MVPPYVIFKLWFLFHVLKLFSNLNKSLVFVVVPREPVPFNDLENMEPVPYFSI